MKKQKSPIFTTHLPTGQAGYQLPTTNSPSGFTLIELIVVVAIIAVLSTILFGFLGDSKIKARDTKRVSDIKEIQLALEVYHSVNKKYPSGLPELKTGGFIPEVPVAPPNSTYIYVPLGPATGNCTNYHLGVHIEGTGNNFLSSDRDDAGSASPCVTEVLNFDGLADQCSGGVKAPSEDNCLDVTP